VVKALTRLHMREDASVGPSKTELLLTEIRDTLQARTVQPPPS
jgi:hypothetical protein